MPTAAPQEIPFPQALRELKLKWSRGYNFLLSGELEARKNASNRWVVTVASVERLRAKLERDRNAAA